MLYVWLLMVLDALALTVSCCFVFRNLRLTLAVEGVACVVTMALVAAGIASNVSAAALSLFVALVAIVCCMTALTYYVLVTGGIWKQDEPTIVTPEPASDSLPERVRSLGRLAAHIGLH